MEAVDVKLGYNVLTWLAEKAGWYTPSRRYHSKDAIDITLQAVPRSVWDVCPFRRACKRVNTIHSSSIWLWQMSDWPSMLADG